PDPEMQARIAQHRQRRPKDWSLVEEPIALTRVLNDHAHSDRCLLVDCLTLWLTNLLLSAGHEEHRPISESPAYVLFRQETDAMVKLLPTLPGRIILVANEVGMGIIPMGELSRVFADETGLLNQKLAETCDRVTLVVAGLPYSLK
ncbi:MAG: bifunctional adenosylcobinamide kinase/adenosylcobinamide-phosphate guanylyltransferase, partial [Acidiferrobacterales bacterium]